MILIYRPALLELVFRASEAVPLIAISVFWSAIPLNWVKNTRNLRENVYDRNLQEGCNESDRIYSYRRVMTLRVTQSKILHYVILMFYIV